MADSALPGLSFGCDPELFLYDIEKSEYVGAEKFLPGTKENPYKVKDGAVQVDGMAAEFNINPVSNYHDFSYNIDSVILDMKKMLPRHIKLRAHAAVTFSEKEWAEATDAAKMLGCSPDFNGWTGTLNSPPNPEEGSRLRTAAGHLHIGWTEDSTMDEEFVKNAFDLVQQLDWYLGAWSVTNDKVVGASKRRQLYGKSGACRLKPYGVEYRVLSNFWVLHPDLRVLTWNRMQRAINSMAKMFMPEVAGVEFNNRLIQMIDSSKNDETLVNSFSYPIKNA